MPLGQSQDIPQADPGGRVTPRFWHRLIRFRHFIDGSLALASLNRACRNLVPAFPQRSPPSLLSTAACGGLRSTPDCRPRRVLLHLSYSSAPSYSDGARDTRPAADISESPLLAGRHGQRAETHRPFRAQLVRPLLNSQLPVAASCSLAANSSRNAVAGMPPDIV